MKRYLYAETLTDQNDIVGDFACGTGYGSAVLSQSAKKVVGVDINNNVINSIKKRYGSNGKVEFIASNILDLKYENFFDKIISFETIEHIDENDVPKLFKLFHKMLKNNGEIIFSVPYMQEKSKEAVEMGFHRTFYIDENKINDWLNNAGFKAVTLKYQNYESYEIMDDLEKKDFIICEANKI